MQAVVDGLNDELKAQREEHERLIALSLEDKAGLEAQIEAVRADLRKETERAEASDRDLDAAIEAHAQVDAARLEAEAACRQEQQARTALEADLTDVRALLDQTVADAARTSGELDAARAEIADLHGSLASARGDAERAEEEARARLDAARRALDAERDRSEQLASSLAEAQAHGDMVRADLVEMQARTEQLQADLVREIERAQTADRDLDAAIEAHASVDAARLEAEADARAQAQARAAAEEELASMRQQLDAAHAQAGRAGTQLEAALAEKRTLAADLTAAQAELEAAHKQREAIAAQLEASRVRLQTLERTHASHEESLQRLETGLNDALQAEASAREMVASVDVDLATARAELDAMRGDVDRLGALLDASSHSVDELASTTTISDLLAALVRQLSVEFSRVALFRLKGNRLEGEYHIGFDEATDITKLVLPLNLDSLITRAAVSGMVEQIKGSDLDDSSRAPFAGSPTIALALPVALQGETVAVVYADSDLPERESQAYDASAGFARLMLRTTAVLMMRLSQELKTLNELRDYAAMLLQEAEEMYNADLQAGRNEDERRARLKDTVECARQLYAQRAALEGAAAASLLDDRILVAMTAEPSTDFSRDLSAAVGNELVADARQTQAS